MQKKKRLGRPPSPAPKRTRMFMMRLFEEEMRLIQEAAGDYPAVTWARAEVLKAARRKVGKA